MATRTTTKKVKEQWVVRTSVGEIVARNDECEAAWKRLQEAEFKSELPAGATYDWEVTYRDGTHETKARLEATTRDQKAERALCKVSEHYVEAVADDAKARSEFARVFENDPAHAIESYSEAVVKTQATLKVWTRIDHARQEMADRNIAFAAACQGLECFISEMRDELRENLLGCRNWEHRSSSQWKNAVAEAQAVAQADLVRRGGWDKLALVLSYLARVRGEAL